MITALVGIGFILSVLIWSKSKRIGLSFIALEAGVGLMSLLGTVQIGPLTKLLYKDSIRDRGYDWKAAMSMFKSQPITGVGLDRYGAYFTQYRSPQYPLIYGYQQTVTNAHNVFLEFFATGGIILGVGYLLLTIFIGIQAVSLFKNVSQKNRIAVTGLIAAWVAFVAQSCISVDCLAISIWGWTLGGAIIGLSIRSSLAAAEKNAQSGKVYRSGEPSAYRGLVFLGLTFCFLLIVVSMYRNESHISKFIASGAPTNPKYQASYLAVAESDFNQTFMSPNYKFQTAVTLIKNNYAQQGIAYLNLTIKADKRHLDSYVLLSRIYEDLHFVDLPKAIEARKEIVKLDPYNAENLLGLENDYLLIKQKDQARQMASRIQEIAPNTEVAKTAAAVLKK
jgi:tetratricopeptide (TPR) repeat protein